jgi:hypothetical protein
MSGSRVARGFQGEKFHSARGTGAISKNLPLSEALRDLWSLECQDGLRLLRTSTDFDKKQEHIMTRLQSTRT